jgi:hypothetical protein
MRGDLLVLVERFEQAVDAIAGIDGSASKVGAEIGRQVWCLVTHRLGQRLAVLVSARLAERDGRHRAISVVQNN